MLNDDRKVCKKCGVEKCLDQFHFDGPGKRRSACKECDAASKRAYRKQLEIERPETAAAMKARQRVRAQAHYARHKEAVLARSRAAYQANKAAINERATEWKRANREKTAAAMARRRAKASSGESFTKRDIEDLLVSQRGVCVACRSSLAAGYHVDHVVPLKLGGGNDRTNIQLLCAPCNYAKAAKHPIDFMQQKGYLL